MNTFGTIVDFLVAVVVCFLFPILYFAQKQDMITQLLVYSMTKDFVDAVKVKGEISKEMYDAFTLQLSSTGSAYHISFTNFQTVYEPEYQIHGASPTFTGTVMEYTNEVYSYDIVETIIDSGRYVFEKGDFFRAEIINKVETFAGKLLRIPYIGLPEEQIIVHYGGQIRDSG